MADVGRPTKYSPAVVRRITAILAIGGTYRRAAQAGGISYETFNEWRKEYSDFSDAINRAETKAAQMALRAIKSHIGKGSLFAATWLLEHRYPEEYGRRVVDADITSGGERIKGYVGISPDDWDKSDKET